MVRAGAAAALAALVALAVCSILPVSEAVYGVDVSTSVLTNNWSCLKSNGYTFGIIRCYQSNGVPDPNCPHTIVNAWNGLGSSGHVDIYLFPDTRKGDPAGQVRAMLDYLKQFNIYAHRSPPSTYGMVWLDIEGPGTYWGSSQSANRDFFNGLVSELHAQGQVIGVYTSKSQWEPIMGDWSGGASFPLFYAHYDQSPSFSDFSPFAGWSHPAIKQFAGTTSFCSVGVDKDYYPNGDAAFRNVTSEAQRAHHRKHIAMLKAKGEW